MEQKSSVQKRQWKKKKEETSLLSKTISICITTLTWTLGKSITFCTITELFRISSPPKTFNHHLRICTSSTLISIQSPEKKRNSQLLIMKNLNWMMLMSRYTRILTLTIYIINYHQKKLARIKNLREMKDLISDHWSKEIKMIQLLNKPALISYLLKNKIL
jgi:hypothetical protein